MKTYLLMNEPLNETYQKFIDLSIKYCDTVLLVVRNTINLHVTALEVLEKLAHFLKSKEDSRKWPGTELLNNEVATVYKFILNDEVAKIISQSSKSLYGWVQPDLPEDLCLLRPDGEPWLVTVSHEKESFLIIDDVEKKNIHEQMSELRLELTE